MLGKHAFKADGADDESHISSIWSLPGLLLPACWPACIRMCSTLIHVKYILDV